MELKATILPLLLVLCLGHSHTHQHQGTNGHGHGYEDMLGQEDMPGQEDMLGQEDSDISDIILTMNNGTRDFLLEGDMFVSWKRNALKCSSTTFDCYWPKSANGNVEVPFTFSPKYNSAERELILTAMEEFHYRTCVRFVPRPAGERMYLSIEPKFGCYSSLGRTGDKQVVSLQKFGCVQHGVVQHELLHALGFQHEQSRSDRDQHVQINYENVKKYFKVNFKKQETNNLDTPYDYDSVMHYGRTAFSKSARLDTITPIPNANVRIGQRKGMSDIDVLRINRLYKCPPVTAEQQRQAEVARQAREKKEQEEAAKAKIKKQHFKNKSSLF